MQSKMDTLSSDKGAGSACHGVAEPFCPAYPSKTLPVGEIPGLAVNLGAFVLGTTSTTPADIRLDVDILVLLAPYGGVPRRVLTF